MKALNYQALWVTLGVLMIAVVVALSLLSVSGPVSAPGIDKIYHCIAYGAMMFWWGMVQPNHWLRWGIILIVLGIGLEYAQSLTGYRTLDRWDALANAGGVVAAIVLLKTPLAHLLAWFDGKLANALNSGLS